MLNCETINFVSISWSCSPLGPFMWPCTYCTTCSSTVGYQFKYIYFSWFIMVKRTCLFEQPSHTVFLSQHMKGLDFSDVYSVSDKWFLLNCDSAIIMNYYCHSTRAMSREWKALRLFQVFQQWFRSPTEYQRVDVFPMIVLLDPALFFCFDPFPVHLEIHRHENMSAKCKLCLWIFQCCVVGRSYCIGSYCKKLFKLIIRVQFLLFQVERSQAVSQYLVHSFKYREWLWIPSPLG